VKQIKQNSSGAWVTLLRQAGDEPIDLTNADSVAIYLRSQATDTLKVNAAACTVVDAADGKISWAYTTTHTDTAGRYYAEFEIDWGGGSITRVESRNDRVIDITDTVSS
jgi:hypothetical protein